MANTIRVHGLKELQRDFKRISKDLDKGLTKELKKAAEPVKELARTKSLARISNLPRTPRWAAMRIGVSAAKGSVYVVPSARRRGGSPRPNLGGLLLGQMELAVEEKQAEVFQSMEGFVVRLGNTHGF